MIPVNLTRIKTRDGVVLDGIVAEPKKKSDTALVWVHGLGSNFSHGQPLIAELSAACRTEGIGYFKFNTRGHDIVNYDAVKTKLLQGAGFEKFKECVPDIGAMIAAARGAGYKKVILAGHSTGANKALYYLYRTQHPVVRSLILLGAVSDIAAGRKKFGAAGLARGVAIAEKLHRRNPGALMPQGYGIFTAKRFLSMFRAGGAEDVFPYLNPRADWKELRRVRIPLAVIFGSRDQYLDRPARKIIEIFRRHAVSTKSLSGIIIKGADHGFRRKEKELSQVITKWIKMNGL